MIEAFTDGIQKRVKLLQSDLREEDLGFIRDQEIESETPIIMNETDFLEPEISGQKPVDMKNIDDEENLERRDNILKEREKNKRRLNILNYGRNFI